MKLGIKDKSGSYGNIAGIVSAMESNAGLTGNTLVDAGNAIQQAMAAAKAKATKKTDKEKVDEAKANPLDPIAGQPANQYQEEVWYTFGKKILEAFNVGGDSK